MNKKGFTLVELLGSIVILAALALIAFPAVLSVLNSGQKKVDESVQNFILAAAEECVNDNLNDYASKCSKVEDLEKNGYISTTFCDKYSDVRNDVVNISFNNNEFSYSYSEVN